MLKITTLTMQSSEVRLEYGKEREDECMSFQEYVNNYYGCDVDVMDLSEEDYDNLYNMWLNQQEGHR